MTRHVLYAQVQAHAADLRMSECLFPSKIGRRCYRRTITGPENSSSFQAGPSLSSKRLEMPHGRPNEMLDLVGVVDKPSTRVSSC